MLQISKTLAALLALGCAALVPAVGQATEQKLQNDNGISGGFNAMSSAYICFQDETYAAEFEVPDQAWYPYTVKRIQTAFVANPLDALLGNTGTPCGRFRVAIWRGSGSATPGEPVWDSKADAGKVWDIPGNGQLVTLDLEKDNALPPPIQWAPGSGKRLRIGLRADSPTCSNGTGNGSFPGMAVDGATPKPVSNWGYGWAVGLAGCAGGKQGNAFWVTAEQFGIKGNFVLRLFIEANDTPIDPPDASGGDASVEEDIEYTPTDTLDATVADTATGGGSDAKGGDITSVQDSAGGDAPLPVGGPLTLTSVSPSCIAVPTADTVVTLTGTGFVAGMAVSVNNVPVEVVGLKGTTQADILIAKDSLPAGAWTVRVATAGQKAILIGEQGLRVGVCGSSGGSPAASGCSSGGNPSSSAVLMLLGGLVVVGWRRRGRIGAQGHTARRHVGR